MYFWKTAQLADDIKNNKVSEKSKMYYYLLVVALYNLVAYQNLLEFEMDMTTLIGEMLITTVVIAIGILITFKSNNGVNGSDYISRVIMLGLPITVKIIVFMSIFQIALYAAVFYYWNYDVLTDLFVSANVVVATILVYWRLNVHLKYINQA
jgi:hypothetical protein